MTRLGTRRRWSVVTALVVAAMAAPVALDRDSFPLSTYPMYSEPRPREVDLPVAVGVDGTGRAHPLSLPIIASSDDPLIVAGELRQAIRGGTAAAKCDAIAERIRTAGATARSGAPLVAVEVAVERHDVVARVVDDPSLVERTVHARCPVPAAQ